MKTAILFIHGFIGASRQFKSLVGQLADCGADLHLHVLPGHEASLAEFRKTNAAAWQGSVIERIEQLENTYDKIVLVGHSMGGLLSVCAAAERPEKIAGVMAIGFPIKISPGRGWIKLSMDAAGPEKEGEDPRVTAARAMAGVEIKSVGEYLTTLPQNLEFLKTVRVAQRAISRLRVPLTVINFEKDEIVSLKSAAFVRARFPEAEVFVLKDSYHFLFDPEEEEFITGKIRSLTMN